MLYPGYSTLEEAWGVPADRDRGGGRKRRSRRYVSPVHHREEYPISNAPEFWEEMTGSNATLRAAMPVRDESRVLASTHDVEPEVNTPPQSPRPTSRAPIVRDPAARAPTAPDITYRPPPPKREPPPPPQKSKSDNVHDIFLFIFSGILLLFLLEQFLQIGIHIARQENKGGVSVPMGAEWNPKMFPAMHHYAPVPHHQPQFLSFPGFSPPARGGW